MVVASLTLKNLIERVLSMAGWYRWVWRDHIPNGTRVMIECGATRPAPDLRLPTAGKVWNDVQPSRGTVYICPRLLSSVRVAGLICDVRRNRGGEAERLLSVLAS